MNNAVFAGRVGADAELKYTQAGKAVASFNLAIDNGKDSEGQKRKPLWVKATLWEKRAESLAQYIKKGIVVIVSGPVSIESWISKQSGEADARIAVNVREFTFGGGKNDSGEEAPAQAAATPKVQDRASQPIDDTEIPF